MSFNKSLLQICPASFKEAKQLEKSVTKALSTAPLNLDSSKVKNVKSFENISDDLFSEIIKSFMHLLSDDEIEKNLFICATRSVYDKVKVTEDFFEEEKNRELYYPIMLEVLKINLTPFIKGLFSQFKGLSGQLATFLKSK